LHALYPQTPGAIADARVQRWHLGNAYARPGRGLLQTAWKALGARQNLHLGGDYYAELGNISSISRRCNWTHCSGMIEAVPQTRRPP
jgi:oxygen-dependent protoporphyrinogen oxidase